MLRDTFTSTATTHDIRVEVAARYRETQRTPEPVWLFQYDIEITNESADVVKLVSRHWIIEHGSDHVEEVRGSGVVGTQPWLGPGERFEYSSWCPLKAPVGLMRGSYLMEKVDGERFRVEVAPFTLSRPARLH